MFDEKAQVSIEMIIVLAALVAIVLLLVSNLNNTAEDGVKAFSSKADEIFAEIDSLPD